MCKRRDEVCVLVCAKDLEGIVAKPKHSSYDPTRTKWFKVKNANYSPREGRREMFNSFKGYNDVAHMKQLSKEVTFAAPAKSSGNARELWPRAAKTGVAYQESFVLREPISRPADVSLTPGRREPMRWEELKRPIDPDAFTIRTIYKRLDRVGDLFSTIWEDLQDISPFCEALHA